MIDVKWNCPNCNQENTDDYARTVFPTCGGCNTNFQWDDFLTDQQFTQLNSKLMEHIKIPVGYMGDVNGAGCEPDVP